MTPESTAALATLRQMARGHPGASSGERAAWEVLQNLEHGTPIDFADAFVSMDGRGKHAIVRLLVDLSIGKTGLIEFR